MKQDSKANYWQSRYENGQTGWDTGSITQPLKDYFDQLKNKDISILIPGCGNAYEAEYLHKQGFTNVYVADIAPTPLEQFRQRVPDFPKEHLLQQDFFALEDNYDMIVEQTFFCAIDPDLRKDYAAKCYELLKTGGILVGLLFDTIFQNPGPPHGGTKAEYAGYFEPYFHFKHFETAYNSIAPRQGRELFIELQKS